MANSLSLQYKPWKVTMSTDPTPSAHLLSLYDLLYDSDGNLLYQYDSTAEDPFGNMNGVNAGHDIIIYNGANYSGGSVIAGDTCTFENWEQYGIDIGLAKFDKRAKALIAKFTAGSTSNTVTKALASNTLYVYDKDSATSPVNIADVYYSNDSANDAYFRGNVVIDVTDLSYTGYPSSTFWSVGCSEDTASYNADIILSGEDSVFTSSMILDTDKVAYNQLCLNPNSYRTAALVFAALKQVCPGMNLSYYCDSDQEGLANIITLLKSTDAITSTVEYANNTYNVTLGWILKHSYVWAKAPFAADYVNPESFNQDLSQDAQVVHGNIISRNSGADFNRYADDTNDANSSDTRPYIPKNAPLKDYITSKFYTASTVSNAMAEIIKDADLPDSLIGAVWSEPTAITGADYGKDDTLAQITPAVFFDPESRKASTDYSGIPTIVPKNGNGLFEGRIMGPTIDEIWYMIKKLISGRPSDKATIAEAEANDYIDTNDSDNAVPYSTNKRENDTNTTLTEVANKEIDFNYGADSTAKTGDPVNFDIANTTDGSASTITITEFFSQPTAVRYRLYEVLQTLSSSITANDTNRTVEKLFTQNTSDSNWTPRSAPLSLRELEALGLGNKYNISAAVQFITSNYALVSPLTYSDDNTSGGLYQFHKDFNYNKLAPNSFWSYNSGATVGLAAVHNDIAAGATADSSGKRTLYASDYGKGLPESNYYDGSQVYLSAKGDWRYVNEYTRLPVLRERF